MVSPSGRAVAANWLAPVMEPPPGTFLTTIVGLPGRYLPRNRALNRAQTSEPPPTEKGVTHSMVLPEKSTPAAEAGATIWSAAPVETAARASRMNDLRFTSFPPLGLQARLQVSRAMRRPGKAHGPRKAGARSAPSRPGAASAAR